MSNGGHHGVSAFLRNYLVKPTCHQLNVNAALRGRQCITVAQGFTKGGCSWCNTLPGDIQRNHKFTFKQCPKFFEGNTFILTSVIPKTQYVLPPMESGQMPLRVSRTFWCSTFLVSYFGKRLRRLIAGPTVCNFNFLASLQGKHGNHKCISEQTWSELLGVLVGELSASEDHWQRFDRADDWVCLANGVSFASIWWKFRVVYDKPFGDQCKRLRHKSKKLPRQTKNGATTKKQHGPVEQIPGTRLPQPWLYRWSCRLRQHLPRVVGEEERNRVHAPP